MSAAGEILKEFVAIAVHELRGPMSAILGSATMRRRWDQELIGLSPHTN